MLTLNSIVKHKQRLDLGDGKVTYVHGNGRVNVEFERASFSSVSSDHLVDCTSQVERSRDETIKDLVYSLLEKGEFSQARHAALDSKFLVWSWDDFLNAEKTIILKFEREKELREAILSREIAESRKIEIKKVKLQSCLSDNKVKYYNALVRRVILLIYAEDYCRGYVEILGEQIWSDFLWKHDKESVAIVGFDDWRRLSCQSAQTIPENFYNSADLCKSIPVSFLLNVSRVYKKRNESRQVYMMVTSSSSQVNSIRYRKASDIKAHTGEVKVSIDKRNPEIGTRSVGGNKNTGMDSVLLRKYGNESFFYFSVAGYKYYQGFKNPNEIVAVDSKLVLKPEPGNQHDEYAIQVFSESGDKLGYVPRLYSKLVFFKIDEGLAYRAIVSEISDLYGYGNVLVSINFS